MRRFSMQVPVFFPATFRVGVAALSLLATGCRVPALVQTPRATALPATYATAQTTDSATATTTTPVATNLAPRDSATVADLPIGQFFPDPVLVALLDTALRQNPDLGQAAARVQQARAELVARRGALLPVVDAVGSAGVDRYGRFTQNGVGNFDTNFSDNISRNQNIPNPTPDFFAGLRASWEVDLWGKLRGLRRAAYLRMLASERGRQLVQTDLVAEVARTYYEVLATDQELEILTRNAQLQARTVELSRIQKEGARATELAVQQLLAQQRRTEALTSEARQRLVEAENRLNRLLGRYPQPVPRGTALLKQVIPEQVQAGVPASMLRRRPDIRQAETELLATQAEITAARAAFFPSLVLTPYAGVNAFRAELLFRAPESLALGILGNLSAPVLNRAAIRAAYGQAAARQAEAWYAFQETSLRGVEEVTTRLRGLENYRRAYGSRQQEVTALNEAVSISDDLFLAGYANYLEVITAQRNVLDAELELVSTRQQEMEQLVELYRALGGGWTAAPLPTERR